MTALHLAYGAAALTLAVLVIPAARRLLSGVDEPDQPMGEDAHLPDALRARPDNEGAAA